MKFLVALAVFLYCLTFVLADDASDADHDKKWEEWKKEHGKSYESDAEHDERKQLFKDSSKMIDEHNALAAQGKKNFTMKMNHFGDRRPHEMQAMKGHRPCNHTSGSSRTFSSLSRTSTTPPAAVNWVTAGAVTPVKDQGQCGSCWSFATTGSLEGQYFLKKTPGKLVSLSEQNLVDCSFSKQGNQGCNGGNAEWAMTYIHTNGGIDTEASYPYTAAQGTCHYSSGNSAATDIAYSYVTGGSESALMQAVATVGPIAIAIDASHSTFDYYSSGVYTESACSSSNLDHAVLAVGYGHDTKTGLNYWLVKNSWSAGWGQQGYVWIAKDDGNKCGVATEATYPSV